MPWLAPNKSAGSHWTDCRAWCRPQSRLYLPDKVSVPSWALPYESIVPMCTHARAVELCQVFYVVCCSRCQHEELLTPESNRCRTMAASRGINFPGHTHIMMRRRRWPLSETKSIAAWLQAAATCAYARQARYTGHLVSMYSQELRNALV